MAAYAMEDYIVFLDGDQYLLSTPTLKMWKEILARKQVLPEECAELFHPEGFWICQEEEDRVCIWKTKQNGFLGPWYSAQKDNFLLFQVHKTECRKPGRYFPLLIPLYDFDIQDSSLRSNPNGSLVTGGSILHRCNGEWKTLPVSQPGNLIDEQKGILYADLTPPIRVANTTGDPEYDRTWMYWDGCLIGLQPALNISGMELVSRNLCASAPEWAN